MYNILFYIFFGLIITAAFFVAFSRNMLNSVFSIIIIFISLSGLLALLNSMLLSFVCIMLTALIFVLLIFFYPLIKKFALIESIEIFPYRYYLIITVSLAFAILSSVVSSTRWQLFDINPGSNSFVLLLTRYLPAILILLMISSVILSTYAYFSRKDESA